MWWRYGFAPMASAPAWEITLLRRPPGARRPRVAGRVVFEAPDLKRARVAARTALEARATGEDNWSLGVLKPLTPKAPGTHCYCVVYAIWEPAGDFFERRDVHEIEVWAADAQDARRLSQADVQDLTGYQPAWRVRTVVRAAGKR